MISSRHRAFALILRLSAASLVLSGCANQNSSYRTQRLGDSPMVITQDAKTRNLVMIPGAGPEGERRFQMCAEAAPDVFSAMSASAAAELGLDSRGSGTQAQARAALAIAEAAGTIERTQTINLMRESMYRTCERYLNGAITQSSLVVQAGRDWRAMMGILAIEQLTRTVRPPSTIIAGGATSASVEGSAEARRELAAAQTRLQAARQGLTDAKATPCPPPPPPPAPPPPPPAPAPAPTPAPPSPPAPAPATTPTPAPATTTPPAPAPAPTTCDARTTAVAAANKKIDEATSDVTTWTNLVNSGGGGASTLPGPLSDGRSGDAPNDASVQRVAVVVNDIVRRAFDTDETQLFCLQMLQDPHVPPQLRTRCTVYLMDKVQADRANLFRTAVARAAGSELAVEMQTARLMLSGFLSALPSADYEAERQAIARALNQGFCDGRSQAECASDAEEGAMDLVAHRMLEIVEQREQARRPQ